MLVENENGAQKFRPIVLAGKFRTTAAMGVYTFPPLEIVDKVTSEGGKSAPHRYKLTYSDARK